MRISIVHPFLETGDSGREEPLGSEYLASIALEQGHEVQIVDGYGHNLDAGGLYERVRAYEPDLLAVSVPMSPQFPDGKELAEQMRANHPQVKICFGGNYPTFAYHSLIQEPWVDWIALYEGEACFGAALEAMEQGNDPAEVDGIVTADKAAGNQVDQFPLIDDLDALPLPARHLTPDYDEIYGVVSIAASRGCPYTCINCSTTEMWLSRRRTRSVDNVIAEIEHLAATYPQRSLNIVDDLFTADRKWMHNFCDRFEPIFKQHQMTWMCNTRLDTLDEELIQRMGATGCRLTFLGVESGSQGVLKEIGKRYDCDRAIELLLACDAAGVRPNVALMMGLPFETKEDLQATIDLAKRIVDAVPSAIANVRPVTPILGTALYRNAEELGVIIEKDDQFHLELKEPRISTRHLSKRDLAAALMECKIILSNAGKVAPRAWGGAS